LASGIISAPRQRAKWGAPHADDRRRGARLETKQGHRKGRGEKAKKGAKDHLESPLRLSVPFAVAA